MPSFRRPTRLASCDRTNSNCRATGRWRTEWRWITRCFLQRPSNSLFPLPCTLSRFAGSGTTLRSPQPRRPSVSPKTFSIRQRRSMSSTRSSTRTTPGSPSSQRPGPSPSARKRLQQLVPPRSPLRNRRFHPVWRRRFRPRARSKPPTAETACATVRRPVNPVRWTAVSATPTYARPPTARWTLASVPPPTSLSERNEMPQFVAITWDDAQTPTTFEEVMRVTRESSVCFLLHCQLVDTRPLRMQTQVHLLYSNKRQSISVHKTTLSGGTRSGAAFRQS